MSLPAGSEFVARAGVSLTGDSSSGRTPLPVERDLFGGALECCHGRWNCQQRDDGAGDGPRLISRDRCRGSASVGRFEAHDIDAKVDADCIRAHADVVVVRRAHCAMTGEPQVGRINMPFGLQVTSAGRCWSRTAASRIFNGALRIFASGTARAFRSSATSAGVQFRRVTANNNTDAGFDSEAVRDHVGRLSCEAIAAIFASGPVGMRGH